MISCINDFAIKSQTFRLAHATSKYKMLLNYFTKMLYMRLLKINLADFLPMHSKDIKKCLKIAFSLRRKNVEIFLEVLNHCMKIFEENDIKMDIVARDQLCCLIIEMIRMRVKLYSRILTSSMQQSFHVMHKSCGYTYRLSRMFW